MPHRPQAALRAGPPWRILALLAGLVLLAHALVLQTSPQHIGPALAQQEPRAPAFVTRSIPLPPPPAAAPAAAPPPAAVKRPAQPVKKPILKPKEAVAQEQPAQAAPDLIAHPEPALPDNSASPADSSALPPPTTTAPDASLAAPDAGGDSDPDSAAAPMPAPPASAVAAPPASPSQTPVTAMALPTSVQLDYRLTGNAKGLTYHASGELVWRNNGSSYAASMRVHALFIGARTLSSQGQISAQGLAPVRFSDAFKTEVAAHFEPDKGQVSFSANTPPVPWVQGGQDRVSIFMQLGGMLAGNPAAFPAGASITMYTVGPRDADTWTFTVGSAEKISLPFGELMAVKLSRQPRREYDQKVEIWYAPSLGYLPVRSKITQANGDFVDQLLSAVSPL